MVLNVRIIGVGDFDGMWELRRDENGVRLGEWLQSLPGDSNMQARLRTIKLWDTQSPKE